MFTQTAILTSIISYKKITTMQITLDLIIPSQQQQAILQA